MEREGASLGGSVRRARYRRLGHQHRRLRPSDRQRREFRAVHAARGQRPLFVLIWPCPATSTGSGRLLRGLSLFRGRSPGDVPEQSLLRDRELPAAERIIEQETRRFMGEMFHRATAPVIQQLRDGWEKPKQDELRRLLNRLPDLESRTKRKSARHSTGSSTKALNAAGSVADESHKGGPAAAGWTPWPGCSTCG